MIYLLLVSLIFHAQEADFGESTFGAELLD